MFGSTQNYSMGREFSNESVYLVELLQQFLFVNAECGRHGFLLTVVAAAVGRSTS